MIASHEIHIPSLFKSLTLRRAGNLVKTGLSFFLSALMRKNILWGMPPIMTLEPTNLCNLKCPLCTTGNGEMLRSKGNMSLDTFEQFINLLGDDIFFLIIYHQGEPYLNKNFFKFVEMAKEKNIYCTTSTNGHYFSEENINRTIDSGLDSMIVSIDGIDQESYEKYRVKGDLQKVLAGTRRLIQIKQERKVKHPLVAIQFLVMKHNEHQIPGMKKLARDIGVDRLMIKNIEVRSLEEAKKWLPENDRYRRYDFSKNSYKVKNAEKTSCPRPWLSALINWDGSVVPCCFDKNGFYNMGNINEMHDFRKIWEGEAFIKFRDQLAADRKQIDMCRNCNMGFGDFIPARRLFQKESAKNK
ncbi:MAG: SPASM domain-containing protein [Calditrichaceae bacterium]|nr:SPASM domain-containing protein [Calditrichaceae bacterium]MBN2707838.1 SPASM domain-containing protein [Calditrichaceae bacterium]RQV94904.1 MAG: radical SAM protein [Calditrichota bacterium]